ncbi:MAG: hypothetical protein V3T65_04610 [Acidobacteriota bacterium]
MEQGIVSYGFEGVASILTWLPQGDSLVTLVNGTYNLVQGSQQNRTFTTLSDGDITVNGQPGVYLGFKVEDAEGVASGGVIGSWACPDSDTSFTLTATSDDSVVVQVRFDRLLDNFACSS